MNKTIIKANPTRINSRAWPSVIGLATILFSGCHTSQTLCSERDSEISQDSLRHVSAVAEIRNSEVHDSVIVRDSVIVMIQDNAVYKERYRDRFHISSATRTDTLRQTDTVTAWRDRWRVRTLMKTEYRERKLSWWRKRFGDIGWVAVAILLCSLFFPAFRRMKKNQ